MRFVAKSRGYSICFKRDVSQRFGPGEEQVLQPLWNCQFREVGITSAEIVFGKSWAINHGVPKEYDQGPDVDTAYRFSVFDTREFQDQHRGDIFERTPEGFTDTHREEMEAFLIAHQDEFYRQVPEATKLQAPWPNYDNFRGVRGQPTAARIAERVQEDGYDIDTVLAYERENRARQDVLDALEALRDVAEPVEDELLVSA